MNLAIMFNKKNEDAVTLWSLSDVASTAKQWKFGRLYINSADDYRITIQASTKELLKNFVGIDDIEFAPGFCQTTPAEAAGSSQTTPTDFIETTEAYEYLDEYACDFEKPCTAWQNDVKNQMSNWIIQKAFDAVYNTIGPIQGFNIYIYILKFVSEIKYF